MKLITELNEEIEYITELRENGKKDHFISGRFIVAEMTNRNGRKYPMEVLEPEVSRYIREVVNAKRALGELNHPAGPKIGRAHV